MEVNDLITFAAVARHAGITRAAKELHTVQSNVTSRIKQLEEEVGVPLFERHSRGVMLTSAGQRLLPYASRAVALLQEAATAARDDGVARGRLTIGSMETTVAVRLPAMLAAYHREHPDVEFEVRTGPTAELLQKVIDSELDGAFVAGPVDHPALVVDHAYAETLVLVTALRVRHPDELRDESRPLTALMFRTGCSYRQRLEQYLTHLGRPGFQRMEFGTLEGILGCVSANLGVTLMPRSVVEKSTLTDQLALHDIPGQIAAAPTLFVRRQGAHESTAMRRFREQFAQPAPTDTLTAPAPKRRQAPAPARMQGQRSASRSH